MLCSFLYPVLNRSAVFNSLQLHGLHIAWQALLSMGFPRQEYWSGLPFPPSGNLPDPGIKPRSPALQADSFSSEPLGKPYIPYVIVGICTSFFM